MIIEALTANLQYLTLMDKSMLDLYAHYLIAGFGKATATDMSEMLDGAVSHDKITRLLSKHQFGPDELWKLVKKAVRQVEDDQLGCLIFDDHIAEKPYMSENELVCWHYAHDKGRSVKGINQLSCLLNSREMDIPVSFAFIRKTDWKLDAKTGKSRRFSPVSKNEHFRRLLRQCVHNAIGFKYVLCDAWYCSKQNMICVKEELDKEFIMAIKPNRLACPAEFVGTEQEEFKDIGSLPWPENCTQHVRLNGMPFDVLLAKKVFKNEDGSVGELYLVCSELSLDFQQIDERYQRRWKVECHHKSAKSNLNYSKCQAFSPTAQQNHCVIALYAFFLLEKISRKTGNNHFALKHKLYMSALKAAWKELGNYKCFSENEDVVCNTQMIFKAAA